MSELHAETDQRHSSIGRYGRFVAAAVVLSVLAVGVLTAGPATAQEGPSVEIDYNPGSPVVGETVDFTAQTSGLNEENIAGYDWHAEGPPGSITFGESQSTDLVVPLPGTYTVTVDVYGVESEEPIATEQIQVQVEPPSLDVDYSPESPAVGETVSFDVSSDYGGEEPGFEWFVEGQSEPIGSGPSVDHEFGSAGEHDVCVIMQSGGAEPTGLSHESNACPAEMAPNIPHEVITVEVEPPQVEIDYTPEEPEVGQQVSFDTTTSGFPEGASYFNWQIDGEHLDVDGSSFERTFQSPGEYTVSVTAYEAVPMAQDHGSGTAEDEVTVTVTDENEPPTADIDASPGDPVAGDKVNLRADAFDSDGSIERYEWTIDGAATLQGRSITYQFASPGEYPVTLTVTDDDGDEATASTTVSVDRANAGPTVSIAPETDTPTQGQTTTIESDATDPDGEIASYEWTVDGTVVSDAETLTHTFDVAGEHEVSLTVTDDVGATASASTTVTANAPPEASIDYEPAEPMVEESVSFTASASDPDGEIASYEWTVDGESAGTGDSLAHAFGTPGEHEVTLTVTDDDGASVTASATPDPSAPENEPPTVGSGDPPADVGVGDPIDIGADASDPDGEVSEYRWLIDGEPVGSGESLQHAFESAGTYEITLEVTDDAGETASESWTVEVSEPEEEPETAGGGLGTTTILLVLLAAVALIVAAGYAYRRAQNE